MMNHKKNMIKLSNKINNKKKEKKEIIKSNSSSSTPNLFFFYVPQTTSQKQITLFRVKDFSEEYLTSFLSPQSPSKYVCWWCDWRQFLDHCSPDHFAKLSRVANQHSLVQLSRTTRSPFLLTDVPWSNRRSTRPLLGRTLQETLREGCFVHNFPFEVISTLHTTCVNQ